MTAARAMGRSRGDRAIAADSRSRIRFASSPSDTPCNASMHFVTLRTAAISTSDGANTDELMGVPPAAIVRSASATMARSAWTDAARAPATSGRSPSPDMPTTSSTDGTQVSIRKEAKRRRSLDSSKRSFSAETHSAEIPVTAARSSAKRDSSKRWFDAVDSAGARARHSAIRRSWSWSTTGHDAGLKSGHIESAAVSSAAVGGEIDLADTAAAVNGPVIAQTRQRTRGVSPGLVNALAWDLIMSRCAGSNSVSYSARTVARVVHFGALVT